MSVNPSPRELVSSIIIALDRLDEVGAVIDAPTYMALRAMDSDLWSFLDYVIEEGAEA